jgi:hypothetical protein
MLGGGSITIFAQTAGDAIIGHWVGGFESGGEFGLNSVFLRVLCGLSVQS